jgi:ADP-ribose pyrophosphatase
MSIPNNILSLPSLETSEIVFQESLITIKKDRLRNNHQEVYDYYTLMTKPFSVVILAMTIEGQFLLTEEYRHPTGHVLLSCPGGYLEEGESPLQGASRELLEETGFQASHFQLMGSAFPYPGISSQKAFYVYATQAMQVAMPKPERGEVMRTTLIAKEALNKCFQNASLDASLCTALFFYEQLTQSI